MSRPEASTAFSIRELVRRRREFLELGRFDAGRRVTAYGASRSLPFVPAKVPYRTDSGRSVGAAGTGLNAQLRPSTGTTKIDVKEWERVTPDLSGRLRSTLRKRSLTT